MTIRPLGKSAGDWILARKGKDDIGLDGCEMKSVEELEAGADPKGIAAVDGLVGATLEPLRLPEAQPTLQLLYLLVMKR